MNFRRQLLAVLALILSIAPAAWCAEQTEASPLDVMAPYVGGVWEINGKWTDGNALSGHEIYEWGPGKKFIACKTFLHRSDGTRFQRYETIFGVKDGKLTTWGFTFNGKVDENDWRIDGKRVSTASVTPGVDVKSGSTLHQSIEQVEPNKFRWVVEQEANGEKKLLMDGMWIRSESSNAVAQKPITFGSPKASEEYKPLDTIAKLIGTWTIHAKWSDGRPLDARQTLEWGVGKRFVRSGTQILKPDGSVEYDRYLTFYGVEKGQPMAWRFINDGSTDIAPVTVEGDRISGTRTFKHGDDVTRVKQFIELTDNDTLHWKVWNENDSPDKPLMDSNWKRDSK